MLFFLQMVQQVNGETVSGVPHNLVLKKIYSNPNMVSLLIVTDLEAFLNTKQLISQMNNLKLGNEG